MLAARLSFAILLSLGFVVVFNYFFGESRAGLFGRGILFGSFLLFGLFTVLTRCAVFALVDKSSKRQRWLFVTTSLVSPLLQKDLISQHFRGQCSFLMEPEGSHKEHSWENLDGVLNEKWSHIVIAEREQLPSTVLQRLMKAKFESFRIIDLFDFYEEQWRKVPLYHVDNTWFLLNDGFKLFGNPIGLRFKRLMDIGFASFGALVSMPIMLIVAVMVKLESKGPIIYKQERTGKNGKSFTIFKFRTMSTDAEKNGAVWASVNDPRVTRIGNFLRKSRLDELPQFFNIIEGSMSFVGPRPERPEFNTNLATEIDFYDLRHLVHPGLTGWAQVMYPYGASIEDAREKLQYDLYYIKNHSVWLDISIILKTIKIVVMGKGR